MTSTSIALGIPACHNLVLHARNLRSKPRMKSRSYTTTAAPTFLSIVRNTPQPAVRRSHACSTPTNRISTHFIGPTKEFCYIVWTQLKPKENNRFPTVPPAWLPRSSRRNVPNRLNVNWWRQYKAAPSSLGHIEPFPFGTGQQRRLTDFHLVAKLKVA
jgi:hypothetical protein